MRMPSLILRVLLRPRRVVVAVAAAAVALFAGVAAQAAAVIVLAEPAAPLHTLAAREAQRYVYVRTGQVLPIVAKAPANDDAIVLQIDGQLAPQTYRLRSEAGASPAKLTVTGHDSVALLYGVYHFAELLGVRFELQGDVVPDERIALTLPGIDRTFAPLFEHRGIQPFHDFPEGPDWWSLDDYKTHISQMIKLRMNWFGLHCYPQGNIGPEPLVWIGLPEDVNDDGSVKFAYSARWFHTVGGAAWGYGPMKTSDYAAGAGLLFASDEFGSPITEGLPAIPEDIEHSIEVFNRVGRFYRDAFTYARQLGVTTVMGTETPLIIPTKLVEHLKAKGIDPADPATVRRLYEGMFKRIAKSHPLDYYWLWTPETWTWNGNTRQQLEATLADFDAALAAVQSQGAPFRFGTCGWVLGPAQDRALFDTRLPKDAPIACVSRLVGAADLDPAFGRIKGRPSWAIPWLEDDVAMVLPQLWAGRMRRDAADAHAYGCTGLMGIHWRTKVLAPNIIALARAGWEQDGWNPRAGERVQVPAAQTSDIHIGGQAATFYDKPIADTDEDPVYQSFRRDPKAYKVAVPNGLYDVTLKFCEVEHTKSGARVFGVSVQGTPAVDNLDVYDKAGALRPHNLTVKGVKVENETLVIEFVKQARHPFIAGIVIDGMTAAVNQVAGQKLVRKINCGGDKWEDFEADLPGADSGVPARKLPRYLAVDDFYLDWCRASFGESVAEQAAAVFTKLDGKLPRQANWVAGPGGLIADGRPWAQVSASYAFVDELEALRPRVRGPGNLARFDYWLNSMRYLRGVGQLSCTRGALDQTMKLARREEDPEKKQAAAEAALKLRVELARQWETMMTFQLAATDTIGEIGTITNLEQHTLRNPHAKRFMSLHDSALRRLLGQDLPQEARPTTRYLGRPRLIVPTVRNSIDAGEALTIKVIVLDNAPATSAELRWRVIGRGQWASIPLTHVDRGVYRVTLPAMTGQSIEYYITATTTGGEQLHWPASAPDLSQTVVVMPK